jgi:peptide/nickel transport system permease protein
VLALTVWGARISLLVGLVSTFITMVLGTGIGLIAGYYGGWRETVLIALHRLDPRDPVPPARDRARRDPRTSLFTIIFVIAISSWPGTARVIRAQVLSLKTRPYVERARALGASDWHMVSRHILPNVGPARVRQHGAHSCDRDPVRGDALVPGAGRPPPHLLGTILENAFGQGAPFAGNWWWIVPPGLAIVFVVLAFTMIGYALDDILNPKLRAR